MHKKRLSGILLHPTSLPGPCGIGELGKEAFKFIDFLASAQQSLWQVLPLGPTGFGDSPYASFSTFAGNPLLISLEKLVAQGDLLPGEVEDHPDFLDDSVEFGTLIEWKKPLLEKAASRFLDSHSSFYFALQKDFEDFCLHNREWLEDYTLFMDIKAVYSGKAQKEGFLSAAWNNYWDKNLALREPGALQRWRTEREREISIGKVWQYYFFRQWGELKKYANTKGIRIIGDIPIFVAPDSVDVWANRELFLLDEEGKPTVVTGVPPDYFSATGQLWGNPCYNWKELQKTGYSWWVKRIRAILTLVDIIRIDHFRGFEAYWEVPAGELTAENGRWVKAPGHDFFNTIKKTIGDIPILAEDLGVITPEVVELRDSFAFPGMKILQFAFDSRESGDLSPSNEFLPHNYSPNSVVYTGTHDNDTTCGWYEKRSPEELAFIHQYIDAREDDISWSFIRMALSSVAYSALFPMQDILSLGSEARMNTPSTIGGNWKWRFSADALTRALAEKLLKISYLYGRNL
ncbi:MAG: 4-alpha-glucanotransferase [Candidatus Omnitrophota bacterium]